MRFLLVSDELKAHVLVSHEFEKLPISRFCNVKTSRTPPPPDPDEPSNVAQAIASWGLEYIVITSVDRDDLPDQGSGHFAETVQKLKALKPEMLIEALGKRHDPHCTVWLLACSHGVNCMLYVKLLYRSFRIMYPHTTNFAVPDFRGDPSCVEKVATSGLHVFAHNIETVEELQRNVRDYRANFKQSIDVLKMAKEYAPPGTLTKTSIMLGCGETPDQVISTMEKVRAAGVDVITFGQYMRPSKRHMPVSEYVTPEAFEKYRALGVEMVCPSAPCAFLLAFCNYTQHTLPNTAFIAITRQTCFNLQNVYKTKVILEPMTLLYTLFGLPKEHNIQQKDTINRTFLPLVIL